jgi:hypothetical protein
MLYPPKRLFDGLTIIRGIQYSTLLVPLELWELPQPSLIYSASIPLGLSTRWAVQAPKPQGTHSFSLLTSIAG